MKQKILIAGPRFHGVGYRPFLIALADEFDIMEFSVHNSVEMDLRLKHEDED